MSRYRISTDPTIRRLVQHAETHGWQIQRGSSHIRWAAPDGSHIIYSACTPSDIRAVRNLSARLKQAGLTPL